MNLAPRRGEELEHRNGINYLKWKRHSSSISSIGFTTSFEPVNSCNDSEFSP